LLAAGPDLKVKNKKGHTALRRAKKEGHTEVIQLLKKAVAKK